MSNSDTLAPTRKIAKAAPSTPVAASPVENEAYAPAKIKAAFAALADSLRMAALTDEPHERSGDSNRLLHVAADLAGAARDEVPDPEEAERLGFDIAALVIASRSVPGDTSSLERQAHIAEAKPVLSWITEAGDVLQDKIPHGTRPLILAGKTGHDVALRCVYDIEALADMLINLTDSMPIDSDPQPAVVRALGVRVSQLNSVAMSYLSGDECLTLRDAHYAVYHGAIDLPEGESP